MNDLDGDGDSAICGAVYGGHLPVVKFLLEAGADPGLGKRRIIITYPIDSKLLTRQT